MDTKEFLKTVLPRGGLKVLAVPKPYEIGGKQRIGWKYRTYDNVHEMAGAATQLDAAGDTVYFAVQGYGDWYEVEDSLGGKPKRKLRTQENVVACRSLYDDFDVGDGSSKYQTREAALADIRRLAAELRMTPTITSSGGGFHAYFTADADMTADEWLELAHQKRAITTHLGMRVDHAVDIDCARVLRPVGTHNRKTDTPRQVVLVKAGRQYSIERVRNTLTEYVDRNALAVSATRSTKQDGVNPFAAALTEYPPASAIKVAQHCAALRGVADVMGDVPEPLWRAMLGLVKHTTEGDALCHEWSTGAASYDADETQTKLDNWNRGPTLCSQFDSHVGCMADCPHAGKIKTPIVLGYAEEAPSAESTEPEVIVPVVATGITVGGEHIPYWPNGYRWDGELVSKSMVDADGVVHWIPFLRSLLYPLQRVRTEDGTWALVIRARETNGDWRQFDMPTSDLASHDTMAKTLAANEVYIAGTKNAKAITAQLISDYTLTMQRQRIGISTTKAFGWNEDYTSFAIGTVKLTKDGEAPLICGGDIPQELKRDFGVHGTLEQWVATTDLLLNRKGAEVMQFAMCHALGAPLVKLVGHSGWHGLPMAIVGEAGHGKTTVAEIACAAFGEIGCFTMQGTDAGTTVLASIKSVSIMNGLPILVDEVSGRDPKDLQYLAYALANGKDKKRLNQAGKFAGVGGEWHTNSFITSNESVYDLLSKGTNENVVDATQLRVFEVRIPTDYVERVFPDIPRTFVQDHQKNQYGHAGRAFLRFVMEHKDWVQVQLARARVKYNPKSQEESKERFYLDAIATAVVAGKIAQKIGLIKFDLAPMIDWAFSHIGLMRESRSAGKVDISEHLAQFVASLHSRTVVTKEMRDTRSAAAELPLEQLRGEPVARIATEAKKAYVTIKAVRDWCQEHRVAVADMRKEMERVGLLIHQAKRHDVHMRIGQGTTVASSLTRCYELNFRLLYGGSGLHVVPKDTKPTEQLAGAANEAN